MFLLSLQEGFQAGLRCFGGRYGIDIIQEINGIGLFRTDRIRGLRFFGNAGDLLRRDTGHKKAYPMIQTADTGADDLHDGIVPEELIIRVIEPGDILTGFFGIAQIVQHQNDGFAAGTAADRIKYTGAGNGILSLRDAQNDGFSGDLFFMVAALNDMELFDGGTELKRSQAKLTQQSDGAGKVVQIRGRLSTILKSSVFSCIRISTRPVSG